MRLVLTYIIGLIFGLGIVISGMANPAKVLNFFDFAGSWDPSLAFVMGGALATTFVGYRLTLRRTHPIFAQDFHLPTRVEIDIPLITGATIFGLGWGISGFCPGGALPAVGTGLIEVAIFTAAMMGGILITRFFQNRSAN